MNNLFFSKVKAFRAPIILILAIFISSAYYLSTPAGLFAAGNFFFGGGAYSINTAEMFFKKAYEKNPSLEGLNYQIARVNFINGDFPLSILHLNQEAILFPEFAKTYYMRGLVFGYMKNLDLAEKEFEKFLEFKPDSWAGHNDLAWIYFEKGDFLSAEKEARDGLLYELSNPWLLNSLGVALLNQKRFEEAKYYFEESLRQFERVGKEGWGKAYPGNNPNVYEHGFNEVVFSVKENLEKAKNGRSG